MFQEKVVDSTEVKKPEGAPEIKRETDQTISEKTREEKLELGLEETATLYGAYKGETEKALLIDFKEKKEIWVPKSAIKSKYNLDKTSIQKFEIDTWILNKNNLL